MQKFILFLFTSSMVLNRVPCSQKPKSSLCKKCEEMTKSLISKYRAIEPALFSSARSLCRLFGSETTCDYHINSIGVSSMRNTMKFIEKTNYLCSGFLCDRNYREITPESFKRDLERLFPRSGGKTGFPGNQKSVLDSFLSKKKGALKILTLNDIHIQHNYKVGGRVDCGDSGGCCSDVSDHNLAPENQAGFWGTRRGNCDIPAKTFEETIKFIKENVDFDILVVLGDLISQDSWSYSKDDLRANNRYVYDTLTEVFWNGKSRVSELGANEVLILPINGNHETEFIDYENYDDQNDFVKQGMLSEFERFIGASGVEEMQSRGYYEVVDSERKVRFIGVDSNFNSVFNSYASIDSTNPLNFIYNLGRLAFRFS